jgi:chemotaxis protein CheX
MFDVIEVADHLPPSLVLPEVLDLKAAAPLATEILSYRGQTLDVDASQVKRLGAQCLQILLSAMATWRTDEVLLSIRHPSSNFLSGLELLGICPADLVDQELSK